MIYNQKNNWWRKLLCLLGFHKWWKTCVTYCTAPIVYFEKCDGFCSKCEFYREETCKYCGKPKIKE